MRVRVVFYGVLKEDVGATEQTLELPSAQSTVEDLIAQLEAAYPTLASRMDSVALAVNDQIVDRSFTLDDGAKVDLLPPVSGGQASV